MNRLQAERIEWFEGFAQRRLGVDFARGLTDVNDRRELIRAAILDAKLADAQPGKTGDTRSWRELYRAVYEQDLTIAVSLADDAPGPRRPA